MKLRFIDPSKGIVVWKLSELGRLRGAKTREQKGVQPPLLWIPKSENHDPKGRNER